MIAFAAIVALACAAGVAPVACTASRERGQQWVKPGQTPTLTAPLAPFADALPVPQRLAAARRNRRLSVPIRAGAHRFHRHLPESALWGYDGTVPGPTIEAERGQPVTVQWRNELDTTISRPSVDGYGTYPEVGHSSYLTG